MLPGIDSAARKSDVIEVLNYVHTLEQGLEWIAGRDQPITLGMIRELHKHLMMGARGEQAHPGEFRNIQNLIGTDKDPNNARFVPPPVTQMHDALLALEEYLREPVDYPPLVRLALIHYQFETIHPFEDGNGRMGRLLISLLLVSWGLLPQPLFNLSAYLERHKIEYCDLLLSVSEGGTWREWLIFFLDGVYEQARVAIERAKGLQDLQDDWHRRLVEVGATAKQVQLADSLFRLPWLTIPKAQEFLHVKQYQSARRAVQRLIDAKILEQAGAETYGKFFYAPELYEMLVESWQR